MGRFISQDPIGFEADVNFYRYVKGNLVKYKDPKGFNPILTEVAKKIYEDFLDAGMNSLVSSPIAVVCASKFYKNRKVRNINYLKAYEECVCIIDEYNLRNDTKVKIPYGLPLSGTDSIVDSCTKKCVKIVGSKKFKKSCECGKYEKSNDGIL